MTQPHKIQTISYRFAKRHGVLEKQILDDQVLISHYQSLTPTLINALTQHYEKALTLEKISEKDFQKAITSAYENNPNTSQLAEEIQEINLQQVANEVSEQQDLLSSEHDAPIINLLNAVFTQAIQQLASDIHIETFDTEVVIRFRIDGLLQTCVSLPKQLAPLIISRIKVLAKLDIAQKRLPQDGRMSLTLAGNHIDVRVSTLPANHNERVVMRILDKNAIHLSLPALGMPDDKMKILQPLLHAPHGILLVTGPTGSGKTTSLYAMLKELNSAQLNILTIEDPIEFDIPGIGQTQVNDKIDMTFAKGLRAILRQDPDIIMIGEIRDLETAEIAIRASLTGHLVLATLHTNTALGAISRLQDMGVAPYLLANSLSGLMAQRLLRKLCDSCKQVTTLDSKTAQSLNISKGSVPVYDATGCDSCQFTGFRGRIGIYELIALDAKLRECVFDHQAASQIATQLGPTHQTLFQAGMEHVLRGTTSLNELLRVTSEAL